MSNVQLLTPQTTLQPATRARVRIPETVEAPVALMKCLVVSSRPERAEMLREAAQQQAWDALVCTTAQEASREAIRNRVQMIIVDLDTSGQGSLGQGAPEGFQELTERLAGESGRLLMLCGNEEDAMEEIWARQLGAWTYLPGVDDQSDVAMLCGEAKNVAEKLQGPTPTPIQVW